MTIRSSPLYFFFAAFPIPDSPTDCGEPLALSKIIRLPVSAVVSSTGLKVTDTLQLLPGLSVFLDRDLTANTDGDALSISTLTGTPVCLLPLFLMVTDLGLLVFPTVVLVPKLSEEGPTETIPTGVGVAVGVWVAVGVAVGVAPVAVAVGVAVRVALAVAVAVLDDVAVAVGVGVPLLPAPGSSFVTKALPPSWPAVVLFVTWNAPVVGKSVDEVNPVIYAWGGLEESTAILLACSSTLPPK